MSDNQEIKKLLVVVLAILVLLGVFVGIRSCSKSDKKEVDEVEEVEKPDVDEKEPEVEENNTIEKETTVTQTSKPEQTVNVVQTVSKKEAPVVTLKQKYSVGLNGDVSLPEVTEDDNGNKVTTEITYEFLPFGSVKYVSVKKIDTSKLGTYKVTYKFTNEDGVSSSTIIYIEIVDNEAPEITVEILNPIVAENDPNTIIGLDRDELKDGDHTNWADVSFYFNDNDEISEVKYYKVERTVEEPEGVVTEITENVTGDFMSEVADGEYLVEAYDRSGNVSEFSFVSDKEAPIVRDFQVTYYQDGDNMSATISSEPQPDPSTSEERLKEKVKGVVEDQNEEDLLEDWIVDEGTETSVTKDYGDAEVQEDVKIVDKAGNVSADPITIDTTKIIKVEQSNPTGAANVNVGNGEIVVTADGSGVVVTINRDDRIDGTTLTATAKINGQDVTLTGDVKTIDLNADGFYDGEGDYVITYEDDLGNTATFTITLSNS